MLETCFLMNCLITAVSAIVAIVYIVCGIISIIIFVLLSKKTDKTSIRIFFSVTGIGSIIIGIFFAAVSIFSAYLLYLTLDTLGTF